jgi:hypothetical protein
MDGIEKLYKEWTEISVSYGLVVTLPQTLEVSGGDQVVIG